MEKPQTDRRYQIRRGVYAILPYGDAFLLTHQVEPEPEFQLPGGGIDSGEHPITALHREVMGGNRLENRPAAPYWRLSTVCFHA